MRIAVRPLASCLMLMFFSALLPAENNVLPDLANVVLNSDLTFDARLALLRSEQVGKKYNRQSVEDLLKEMRSRRVGIRPDLALAVYQMICLMKDDRGAVCQESCGTALLGSAVLGSFPLEETRRGDTHVRPLRDLYSALEAKVAKTTEAEGDEFKRAWLSKVWNQVLQVATWPDEDVVKVMVLHWGHALPDSGRLTSRDDSAKILDLLYAIKDDEARVMALAIAGDIVYGHPAESEWNKRFLNELGEVKDPRLNRMVDAAIIRNDEPQFEGSVRARMEGILAGSLAEASPGAMEVLASVGLPAEQQAVLKEWCFSDLAKQEHRANLCFLAYQLRRRGRRYSLLSAEEAKGIIAEHVRETPLAMALAGTFVEERAGRELLSEQLNRCLAEANPKYAEHAVLAMAGMLGPLGWDQVDRDRAEKLILAWADPSQQGRGEAEHLKRLCAQVGLVSNIWRSAAQPKRYFASLLAKGFKRVGVENAEDGKVRWHHEFLPGYREAMAPMIVSRGEEPDGPGEITQLTKHPGWPQAVEVIKGILAEDADERFGTKMQLAGVLADDRVDAKQYAELPRMDAWLKELAQCKVAPVMNPHGAFMPVHADEIDMYLAAKVVWRVGGDPTPVLALVAKGRAALKHPPVWDEGLELAMRLDPKGPVVEAYLASLDGLPEVQSRLPRALVACRRDPTKPLPREAWLTVLDNKDAVNLILVGLTGNADWLRDQEPALRDPCLCIDLGRMQLGRLILLIRELDRVAWNKRHADSGKESKP